MTDATYEQVGTDWIGRTPGGQRTMLKRTLGAAQADVTAGRVVCSRWPDCPHRDADECGRAQAASQRREQAWHRRTA